MRSKAIVGLALAAALAGALVAPFNGALAAAKPVLVGEDPAGDWGSNTDPNIGPAGDALGMDLVGAEISMADASTVNFAIKVNSLPPSGGIPEIVRYVWDFNVDGELYELDGKFLNYSRGACDPTSGQCPPPRDPGMQPFLLRGNCRPDTTASNITVCDELGIFQAQFDSAAGTITIALPLADLKAKKGSKIQPGANSTFGGSVVAVPSAFVSNATMPMDLLTVTKTFTVPKK